MQESIMNAFSEISLGKLTLSALVPALLTFIVCLIAIKLISKLTDKLLNSSKRLEGTLRGFIRSAVKITLWLVTAIIVADSLGIQTSSLVALVSVAGLALSLSVQNIMANLFSGVTLLMSKPFVAGDYVDIAGKSGVVITVGLFYTVMETFDNTVISIPNGDVTAAAVTNYSSEPLRRVDMHFSASYDDAAEAVRTAILEAAGEDARVLAEPAPFVGIESYKASSIDYIARIWCRTPDYWDVYYGMNERVRRSFQAHGVQMSYEHMNVHIIEK